MYVYGRIQRLNDCNVPVLLVTSLTAYRPAAALNDPTDSIIGFVAASTPRTF